jgi:hypothetical protein
VLLFILLVLLLGALAYNFFLLNQRNQQETQYLGLTTDIQVRAQQLAKAAGEAAVGNFDAFDELRETRDIINVTPSGSFARVTLPPPCRPRHPQVRCPAVDARGTVGAHQRRHQSASSTVPTW